VPVPTAHQFKPGQSGNPKGRVTAGATVREWWNVLAEQGLTPRQLQRIIADPDSPFPKIEAAIQILQSIELGDVTDMEDLLDGKVTLRQLRESGVNTRIIKKIKVKRRTLYNEDGPEGEEVEREVELHNRAGDALDRIMDRTDGRPKQQVDVTSGNEPLRTSADGEAAADQVLDRLRGLLGETRPEDAGRG
jgi:hypothetical protein